MYRAHHEAQRSIAKAAVEELKQLWMVLDPHDLQRTTAPWLKLVRPVVERGYLTSQYVAAEFVQSSRSAALPSAPDLEVDVPNPLGPFGFHHQPSRDTQLRITVAMKVTGPGSVMSKSYPGLTDSELDEMMVTGFNKSCGAAVRIILNGGRGMVRDMVSADPYAVGVQSVAEKDSCASCRFLAETPLLKSVHTPRQMDSVAVGHDFCTCTAKPIY